MLSSGSAVAAVALVDEAVGDDGGTAAGMRKRGRSIGWSVGGWRCRHRGSGVTLSVMSVCVGMVEVVGKELCLVCALGGRWWRRCGWLAGGLISGGWPSVSKRQNSRLWRSELPAKKAAAARLQHEEYTR